MAFAIGAGIGSGLGYRMGSSQIAVYTAESHSDQQTSVAVTQPLEFADLLNKRDEEFRRLMSANGERLNDIEQRMVSLESRQSDREAVPTENLVTGTQQRADQLQSQLLSAGFAPSEYDVISSTRNQLQLKRLQLRDKAIREGWFRSEAWLQQSRALDADTEIRKQLGDDRFDDYLTATGRNNRVKIDEVMEGSAAQEVGLQSGDLIHRYADSRVFTSTELRNMTTIGEAGEATSLTVQRDGELIDLSVPRGPLGVIISGIAIGSANQ